MDPAGDVSPFLAPWDPEPSVQWTEEMVACYQQMRLIWSLLRDLGMLENDIQGWTDRLESVSAIVQRGCALSGVPDAGLLLLDMIIELLQAILRNDDPLPAAVADESPAQLEDQEGGPLPLPSPLGEVSAAGILGRDLAGNSSRSSSDEVVLYLPPQPEHKRAQP